MATNLTKDEIVSLSLEILIKAVLLGLVLFYAFSIIKPFIIPVVWAIIIAVTISPFIDKMEKYFHKRKLIIVSITFVGVLFLLLPTYFLGDSIISSSQKLAHDLREGTLSIALPKENVKSWPIVGEKVYDFWHMLSTDLKETLTKYQATIKEYGGVIASAVGSTFLGIFQFVASLIIAAIFLFNAQGSISLSKSVCKRLAGEEGLEWLTLSVLTVRSVVQGVIGIAIIQASLSFVGLVIMDVPFAWLWAGVVLLLAIVQLPPWLILGPIIAYVFSYADNTAATIFAVYSIVVSISDGFLKPFLLGRGVDIPMLVILLGAIGGMLVSGILGLFVGAVGLSIAYKLFLAWLKQEQAVSSNNPHQN